MTALFEPAVIHGLTLSNRIVKSGTQENMAGEGGRPSEQTRAFYRGLARGGAGLIITGLAYVNETGQSYLRQHGAHTDAIVQPWREIVDDVHRDGGKIALQIAHGGRQIDARTLRDRVTLAPSAIPELTTFSRPRAMTEAQIWQTIEDFGRAAARGKAAGFDAVQIHAAHGFLIAGFLSPLTNRRNDAWGGDATRRSRFLVEVYRAVREVVGDDYPVLCKIVVDDFVPFGVDRAQVLSAVRHLEDLGLDAIEISGGVQELVLWWIQGRSMADIVGRDRPAPERLFYRVALQALQPRPGFREAYFLPVARDLKRRIKLPVMLPGGNRSYALSEQIVAEGWADYILMARPLVHDPQLPNRWAAGSRSASRCWSCNRCLGEVQKGGVLRCYRDG